MPSHRGDCLIDRGGIDAVSIVEDERMGRLGSNDLANCWIVHSAVGCSVTFQSRIRRVPTSRTMKTYRMRKRTVTVVKKSQATTACA
jgi:hypothetical protein